MSWTACVFNTHMELVSTHKGPFLDCVVWARKELSKRVVIGVSRLSANIAPTDREI